MKRKTAWNPKEHKLRAKILAGIDELKVLHNESACYIDYVRDYGRKTTLTQERLDAFLPNPAGLLSCVHSLEGLSAALNEYLRSLSPSTRRRLRKAEALGGMEYPKPFSDLPLGEAAHGFLQKYLALGAGNGKYVVDMYDLAEDVLFTDDVDEACSFAESISPSTVFEKIPSERFPGKCELHEITCY